MDFKDKVVIVTGSSSGIGAVTAEYFAKQSAKVVIVGRNDERLKNVAKTVEEAKGYKPLVVKADLRNDVDIKKIVDETIKQYGQIDILVNNAGAGALGKVQDGIETFDEIISLNLRSVFLLTNLAAPYLIESKGNIINVSSIVSVRPTPDYTSYCISKAGLDMFTKCVAKDLANHGVRVNSVNPGPVKTNFQEAAGFTEEQTDNFFKARTNRTALGRISTSEDVAELIIFLASSRAKSITGSICFVECGDLLS